MNLFEKAARNKFRFYTSQGTMLSVEDLFDLPLTSARGMDLNDVARTLFRKIKEQEVESFLSSPADSAKKVLEEKLEIVKHIIEAKEKQAEKNKKAAENRARKQKIMEIIHRKENQALEAMDIVDLEKLLDEDDAEEA